MKALKKIETRMLKHVNLVDEALYFLYHLANTENIYEKETFVNHFPHTAEAYQSKFAIIAEIFEAIKKDIKSPREKINYYFKERTGFFLNYGTLVVVYERYCYNYTLEQLEKRAREVSIEEMVKIYADLIWDEGAETTPDEQLTSFDDLITFLEKSPLKGEECWEIVNIFKNQKKYLPEVLNIISEVVHLLKWHQDKIQYLEKLYVQTWKDYWASDKLITWINEKFETTWVNSGKGCAIVPSLFLFNTTLVSLKNKINSQDIIRISVLFDDQMVGTEKLITSERVVRFGKMISDKSKVEILKLISEKPAYGKEIAEALGLSTATISYHVNALTEVGVVKINVEANKVYYAINKQAIHDLLEDIMKFFECLDRGENE